jgi:hypothetical protein
LAYTSSPVFPLYPPSLCQKYQDKDGDLIIPIPPHTQNAAKFYLGQKQGSTSGIIKMGTPVPEARSYEENGHSWRVQARLRTSSPGPRKIRDRLRVLRVREGFLCDAGRRTTRACPSCIERESRQEARAEPDHERSFGPGRACARVFVSGRTATPGCTRE